MYSGIFTVHLHYHASKERTSDNTKQNFIFYALCVLYVLSAALFALDTAKVWFDAFVSINEVQTDDIILTLRIDSFVEPAVFACCDFIAQCILVRASDKSFPFSLFI